MTSRSYSTYTIRNHLDSNLHELFKQIDLNKEKIQDLGTYTAQRPSTAACKAFTQLRRKMVVQDHGPTYIFVKLTMSCKRGQLFEVRYKETDHTLLGTLKRPCAKIVDTVSSNYETNHGCDKATSGDTRQSEYR